VNDDEEDEDDRFRQGWRDEALALVKIPGLILQIMGVLDVLAGLSLPVLAMKVDTQERGVVLLICLVGTLILLPAGILTYLGGSRMKALRSYGLALTGVIINFVVSLLFCTPLVLVGIWPLVVLLDSNVRENFRAAAE
jgi:hypothetical protein